ncbi:MAG: hypothetical protein U9R23_08270 [Candidatus Cloacimonadota bacterium]|nr:hypothetical protein [Candidatus Cloacimonadota bacterium]
MKRLFLIIFITFSATSLFAQNASIPKDDLKNIFSFPSQFHLKNLNTSHSFSISTFYSSESKKSKYLTNFCNSFHFKLSPKLNVKLDLNVINYGNFNTTDKYFLQGNTKILPNFQLDYSPNQNFQFKLIIRNFLTVP